MAERRMFAKTIVESDAFYDMPATAQLLYFHLGMLADDDGFINGPKKIMRMMGASEDDMKLLLVKKFLLSFDSGVVVVKHWKINNYLQSDRKKPTAYQEEYAQLGTKENKSYYLKSLENTGCIQNVYKMYTQDSIGKDSIDKISLDKDSIDKPTNQMEMMRLRRSDPLYGRR